MALIKCPECGKDVSDQAEKCPNCGHPVCGLKENREQKSDGSILQVKRKKILVSAVIAIVAAVAAVVVYYVATADSRNYAKAQEMYAAGSYQEALNVFTALGDYEDSASMVEQCEYELTVDRQFVRAFSDSLAARWAASDAEESYGEDPILYEAWSQMELDALTPYTDKEFNDPHLQELLTAYLGYLNDAIDSTTYFDSNYSVYSEMWNDAYKGRCGVIKELTENYELTVPEQYQEYLDGLIDAANAAAAEQAVRDASHAIADAMTIETITDEYGINTYKAVLENTGDSTYKYFFVNIQVMDESGMIVGNGSTAQIENWKPGQKASVDAYIVGVDSLEGLTIECTPSYDTGFYFE